MSPAARRDRAPRELAPLRLRSSGSTAPRSRFTTSSHGAPASGSERTMGLRAPLIAQKDLRALVAHEKRRGRPDLRRQAREDRSLADGEGPRARPRELEHDGRAVRLPRRAARRRPGRAGAARAPHRARRRTVAAVLRASTWTLTGGRSTTVPCARACASDAVGTTSVSMPTPPTPASRGSSVTHRRAGLAKRSR